MNEDRELAHCVELEAQKVANEVARTAVGISAVSLQDLPLGTRFKHEYCDEIVWVILEHHGY